MMKKLNPNFLAMKKYFLGALSTLLFSAPLVIDAQQFRYHVDVAAPTSAGLYRVSLKPDWLSKMNANYSDVRIKDQQGKELPYEIRETEAFSDSLIFQTLSISSQKHQDTFTELVVENLSRQLLSSLAFHMKNSDAVKYCALEGSNDLKQWYSISARQEIRLANSQKASVTLKVVEFPATEHRYLRLIIGDFNSRPFEIIDVGYFIRKQKSNPLIAIPLVFKPSELSTEKNTEYVIQANAHLLHKLEISVKSPRLFQRQIDLFKLKGMQRELVITQTITHARQPCQIDLAALKTDQLLLVIHNEDNRPLEISEINGFQKEQWLISDLDTTATQILFGGTENKIVHYDIASFITAQFMTLPSLTTSGLKVIPITPPPIIEQTKPPFYEQAYFMWICIATGAAVAIYFSYTLLKDMKSNT